MKGRLLADMIGESASRLDQAGVVFGHGTTDALQEASWLAASVLGMSWDELRGGMQAPVTAVHAKALHDLVTRRIATRKPAAYLLHEAWLGKHKFYVDERVIVPRSFIFELLRDWKAPAPATVLDLCTGSGCLAILAALAFPEARVEAADLSADALEVAKRNVADYGLGGRVRLVESDLFAALEGRAYDLIISNPPYVKAASMLQLPEEYRREPRIALASGADGLDHTRAILANAHRHLEPRGRLVVEIGRNRKALEKAFPRVPFEWPKTSGGRLYVFALERRDLPRAS
jgi:ribosomal protein L3 glutamine methyltransferase